MIQSDAWFKVYNSDTTKYVYGTEIEVQRHIYKLNTSSNTKYMYEFIGFTSEIANEKEKITDIKNVGHVLDKLYYDDYVMYY